MALTNGRPVYQTLAFNDQHQRVQTALTFFNRQVLTDNADLLSVKLETDKIKDISVDVDVTVAPSLTFPLYLNPENGVLIDGRRFRGSDNEVRNVEEISNLTIQAALEYYWCSDVDRFSQVSKVTAAIYGSWIASAMKARMGIGFDSQMIVRMVFAFYYWVKFKSEDELSRITEEDLEYGFYSIATGQFKLQKELVDNIYEAPGVTKLITLILETKQNYNVELLNWICKLLPECLDIPSFKSFDYSALYSIVSGKTWVGKNSVTMTLGALEHPPVLMTMVAIAEIKKSFYQKSAIGMLVKNLKAIRISGGDVTRSVKDCLVDIQDA